MQTKFCDWEQIVCLTVQVIIMYLSVETGRQQVLFCTYVSIYL